MSEKQPLLLVRVEPEVAGRTETVSLRKMVSTTMRVALFVLLACMGAFVVHAVAHSLTYDEARLNAQRRHHASAASTPLQHPSDNAPVLEMAMPTMEKSATAKKVLPNVVLKAMPTMDKEMPTLEKKIPSLESVLAAVSEPPCKAVDGAMCKVLGSTFDPDKSIKEMEKYWYQDMQWDGPVGYGNCSGLQGWLHCEHYPFRHAFPTPSFNTMIHVGSGDYSSRTSYINTLWTGDCQGIPPNNGTAIFRAFDAYKCVRRGKDYKLLYNWVIFDMLLMMYQAKPKIWVLPIPEEDLVVPQFYLEPPIAIDGFNNAPFSWLQDPKVSAQTKKVIDGFISALNRHEISAESLFRFMEYDVRFYGSVGIGFTKDVKEFSKYVLEPIRTAIPNFRVEPNFDVIAEGKYAALHGYIVGQHLGPYLGQPATGKFVRYRFSLDWYLRNGKISQSWAIVDIPHLFLQFGVDLFKKIPK